MESHFYVKSDGDSKKAVREPENEWMWQFWLFCWLIFAKMAEF